MPNESSGATAAITPTGAETETIPLGGTLSDDTTLYAGVYHISSNLTVPAGTTMELKPGAILKFGAGRSMTVNGIPQVRTCITLVEEGMQVETQEGLGRWRDETC